MNKTTATIVPQENEPILQLIAVVIGSSSNPGAYMPTNNSNVIEGSEGSDTSDSVSTVTAVATSSVASASLKVHLIHSL